MPYVRVEMLEGRNEQQKAAITEAIARALVEHAQASLESVTIVFEDVRTENWAHGGKLVSQIRSRK